MKNPELHQIVTVKEVETYFNVSVNSAKRLRKEARLHYNIKSHGSVTLAQIITANNLSEVKQ